MGAPAEPCESILDDVIASVEAQLNFRIDCRLHFVIYASNEEARAVLCRVVPASMLLAPLQSASESVVAVQSARADPANGDLARMRRLLTHELAHVAVALRTGSEKRLGDEDRLMRVQPWVNEGFACVLSAVVCQRLDLLERDLAREGVSRVPDLNSALNDLVDANRSTAFAIATSRIWRAVQAHGLLHVFANLDQPEIL